MNPLVINPLAGELQIPAMPTGNMSKNWRLKLGKNDYGVFNAQGQCIGAFFERPEAGDAVRCHNEYHAAMRNLNVLVAWLGKQPAETLPPAVRETLDAAQRQLSEYRKHGVKQQSY